jgi:hypothetical protein
MNLSINSVLGIRLWWNDTVSANVFINQLHYRVQAGELPWDDTTAAELFTLIEEQLIMPMKHNLPNTVSLFKLHTQIIAPAVGTPYEKGYGPTDQVGSLSQGIVEDLEWRAAAVLIRYAYGVGRRYIGRTFFGPLLSRFMDTNGRLAPNPPGDGDLSDVTNGLRADQTLVVGTSHVNLRPIICANKLPAITDSNDVRSHLWSAFIAYLRTRKPGRGV